PKIAPVPYSIRMKFATYTGSFQFGSNGWIAFMPVSKPSFSAVSSAAWEGPRRGHSGAEAASGGVFLGDGGADGWAGWSGMKLEPDRVCWRVVENTRRPAL